MCLSSHKHYMPRKVPLVHECLWMSLRHSAFTPRQTYWREKGESYEQEAHSCSVWRWPRWLGDKSGKRGVWHRDPHQDNSLVVYMHETSGSWILMSVLMCGGYVCKAMLRWCGWCLLLMWHLKWRGWGVMWGCGGWEGEAVKEDETDTRFDFVNI